MTGLPSQCGEGAGREAVGALAAHPEVALPAVPARLDAGPLALAGRDAAEGQHEEVVLAAAGAAQADRQHHAPVPECEEIEIAALLPAIKF